MLAEVTRKVQPPRALAVDTELGYPLGRPFRDGCQRKIIKAALALLDEDALPHLSEFSSDPERTPCEFPATLGVNFAELRTGRDEIAS